MSQAVTIFENFNRVFSNIKSILHSFFDALFRYGSPTSGFAVAVFGLMWEKDAPKYITEHLPNWKVLADFLSNWLPAITFASFGALAFFSIVGIFITKSVSKLKKELAAEKEKVSIISSDIETLIKGFLLRLSEKLEFTRGETSRITIYIHNGNNKFVSFGRYSPDPTVRGKGRSTMNDNEGCISTAWSSDWCHEGNLLAKDAKSKYNITKENMDARKMKSVYYAVKRIDAGHERKPIAVLVVESTTQNRFEEGFIKSILDGEETNFADIISCFYEYINDPFDAKRRGF